VHACACVRECVCGCVWCVHAVACVNSHFSNDQVVRSRRANKIHLLAHAPHSGEYNDDDHLLCLVTDNEAELWDLRMCQSPAAASCALSDNCPSPNGLIVTHL
jgi:hypothetical protein